MNNFITTPALIIGTGISGLFNALKLAEAGISVLLITKTSLAENNSSYAQGGIAAVLPQNIEDSLERHLQDTLIAGAGLCEERVARSILDEGFLAIEDLLRFGVPFDREKAGNLAFTLEAGHSIRRIIHAGGDATGRTVENTLIQKVKAEPLIRVMEYCPVVALLEEDGRCVGCRAVDYREKKEYIIAAGNTVLATGGIGRLYSHTTNPSAATGDGIILAYKLGAALRDIEFIQFHPTAFFAQGQSQFLISEALRGEGGILRDPQGIAFAGKYHPHGELAPRDIVTRAIYEELCRQRISHVYLDITHLAADKIQERFPTILENCLRFGVDIRRDLIPVAPAAHYIMGGLAVDLEARSTLHNLYVVGESAYTGLHGANRLASNSLLECIVLSSRAAENIRRDTASFPSSVTENQLPGRYVYHSPEVIEARLSTLHELMWSHAGIVREAQSMREALNILDTLQTEAAENGWERVIPAGVEYVNQLQLSQLILTAALNRQESRGAHYRSDYPETAPVAQHSLQVLESKRPENKSIDQLPSRTTMLSV